MATRPLQWWLLVVSMTTVVIAMMVVPLVPGWDPPVIAENRVLASRPSALVSIADLARFREDTNAWVADTFPARATLITSLNYARYRLGYSGTSRVFVGREGWLFYDDGSHFAQMRKSTLEADAVDAWVDSLEARTQALASRGITYLVVAPPVKERVYPELMPDWVRSPRGASDADVLIGEAWARGVRSVIDVAPAVIGQKQAGWPAYTPYDVHWTGSGAYGGYSAIVSALVDMGEPLRLRSMDEFAVREPPRERRDQDVAHMLGVARYVDQRFAYLEDADLGARSMVQHLASATDWTSDRVVDTGRVGPVLLFTGDSFSNALLPMLSVHFSRVIFSHNQNGYFREDLIERFAPDVVVSEVLESGLRHAMSMPSAGFLGRSTTQVMAPSRVDPWMSEADDLAAGRATYQCSVDAVSPMADEPSLSVASGWFADVRGASVPEAFQLVFQNEEGAWAFDLSAALSRPDVTAYFKVEGIERSGFSSVLALDELPRGIYRLHFRAETARGALRCATASTFEVGHDTR